MTDDRLARVLTSNFNRAMLNAQATLDRAEKNGIAIPDAEGKLKVLAQTERRCRQASRR